MIKAIGYLRISDVSQSKGDGYTRQETAIRAYAEAHDIDIVNIYREQWTGTEDNRPALAEMMLAMEHNHTGVKTVIIERLDRLARDLMIQEAIVRDFQAKQFTLISAEEGPDLLDDNPTRKFIRQVLGATHEFDKSMVVAKLRAARDRKRAKTGRCEGRQGYSATEEGRTLVRHVKTLYRKPKYGRRPTLQQIADRLNEEGVKTLDGKRWTLHRVRDIVLNR